MLSLKKTALFVSLCWCCIFTGMAHNDPATLPESEVLLKTYLSRISPGNPDSRNIEIADSLVNLLEKTLQIPGAFEYAFDQLKSMGKITSPDRQIRILTWNLHFSDGSNQYFGFILRKSGGDQPVVYRLTDRSATMEDPIMATCSADNWYGCLVYSMVEKKAGGQTLYTLFGYDPENLFTTKKLLDLLWFDEQDHPVFGKPLFHYNKRLQSRIFFEYSAKVQMSLSWNEKSNMIIFDHLAPSKPSYTGNYQYYGPDLSFDGLRFEKGIWEWVENVDIKNEK